MASFNAQIVKVLEDKDGDHVEVSYGDCKQWLTNIGGTPLPRIDFSVKYAAIMMIIAIGAATMGTAHGMNHVQHRANNTIGSPALQYDGNRAKHSRLMRKVWPIVTSIGDQYFRTFDLFPIRSQSRD